MSESNLPPDEVENQNEHTEEESTSNENGVTWLLGGLIVLLVILALWIGFGRGDSDETTAGAEVQITPVSGGATMPTNTPILANSLSNSTSQDDAEGENSEGDNAEGESPETEDASGTQLHLLTGQLVVADNLDGKELALYADADKSSPRLIMLQEGTLLTVIEPSGDYDEYPVQQDGIQWYRVRAEDGLVGWVDGNYLEPG